MLVSLTTSRPTSSKHIVTFTRAELNAVMSLYSFQVSKGDWRDYALDFTRGMAAFSAFRHAHEQPLVSVVKIPANTATGFLFEVFIEKQRLSRTPFLEKALEELKVSL